MSPGDHGTELGVDLYDLLKAGKSDLPSLANMFDKVRRELDSAESLLSDIMSSRGSYPNGSPGPMYSAWQNAQVMPWTWALTTDTNLRASGEALVKVVEAYKRTDSGAAAELNHRCEQYGFPGGDVDPVSYSYDSLLDGARQIEEEAKKLDAINHPRDPYSQGQGVPYPSYPTNTPQPPAYTPHDYSGEIVAVFQPYASLPDPVRFDAVLHHLDSALQQVNTGGGDLADRAPGVGVNQGLSRTTTAGGYLLTWTGNGADTFKAEVLDKVPYYAASQFGAILALKNAVEGQQALMKSTRDGITDVVNDTLTAFDHATDCHGSSVGLTLTILAAVAAIATAIPTAGESVVLTAAVIGSVASVGAAAPLGDPWQGKISGSSSPSILSSMKDAIDKLKEHAIKVESDMSAKLAGTDHLFRTNSTKFFPARPPIADMSVEQLLSDQGLGYAD